MVLSYTVANNKYFNIKQVLKEEFNMSDRLILKLKTNKKIYLNGENTYINHPININDIISVSIDFIEDNSNILPTKMDLDIIYEDDSMLIVNKGANLPIHPSMLHYDNSLANGVKYYFEQIGLKKKIRPVNRLDKDTSGIVIFAKNEYIQECLVKQMKQHIFQKEYIAIVNGILEEKSGTIHLPIARKAGSIIEREVCMSNSDDAITHYKVLQEIDSIFSVVHVLLETGRTHQIRVHFSHLGHSIVGDTLYGASSSIIKRQALHAYKITFIHPITKKEMSFSSPLPDDMKKLIPDFELF